MGTSKKTVTAAVEMVDIVDKDDKVIGQASRDEVVAKKLRHRIVYVYLINDAGEILVQWRSSSKKLGPRLFVSSAAGGVLAGESYADAAKRELQEEMGVATKLTRVGAYQLSGKILTNGEVFVGRWDGEVSGWEDEADGLDYWSADVAEFMLARFPYLLMSGLQKTLPMVLDEMK